MTEQFISKEKKAELERESVELRSITIPAIARRIDDARQMGDLSENAEYHQAREDMAWAQSRVKEIALILEGSTLITEGGTHTTVSIGCTVTLDVNGRERVYTIVGAQEANPLEGKISNESPIGVALAGKKAGDRVLVETPAGTQEYMIKSVA